MTQTHPVQILAFAVEHLQNLLGVGAARPRLSWQVETTAPGWVQAAYELESSRPGGETETTGRIASGESVLVDWPFAALASRQQVQARVRAWGVDGSASGWSAPLSIEAALLDPADWSARFVGPAESAPVGGEAARLRKNFALKAGIRQARLYITALGVYEAEINGQPVHDHVLAPGWTSYSHRLRYQICDVTALLREGQNAIGALLGDGWFRGRLGFGGGRSNIYGERTALLAQLEVTYSDGSVERIVTDAGWRSSASPITAQGIYDGEDYDARLEQPGWTLPGFDDSAWSGVQAIDWDMRTLFAPLGPPVRRTEELAPVSIFQSPAGKTLVDFGQNLVGRLRIKVSGPAGTTITLRHAEVLEHGELGTRPLRNVKATDHYTLKGQGEEVWEPRFTFHGFRYAEIEGWPGDLRPDNLRAVVCHSDMQRTGWFTCSDDLLNRLHENVRWSMRGNFLDIPTDCPQRDERLGWTGDIQVFSPTASFLYDCAGFLASWLRDLSAEQMERGGIVPFVVPDILGSQPGPGAAWGDAAAVIPWVLYQRFGDRQVLADQYTSIRAWVDAIAAIAGDSKLWDTGFQFGDWLDPAAPPENPAGARTPPYIVATAYLARSAEIVALAAGVLGKREDEARYHDLAQQVREAFTRNYVTPAGRMLGDASTGYALALQFALLPDGDQRRFAGRRLAQLARASGYRISTGFVGTPLICDALCSVGDFDTAFRLLTARANPSWLYPVTMGATTIWERWDSMLPDGSINPGEMTSFNHYALGAVADWMHRTLGGLVPLEPGYRRMAFQPRPGGGVTSAEVKHRTPYGMATCAWRISGGTLDVTVTLPPNTTAEVRLPGQSSDAIEVGSGTHHWQVPYAAARTTRPRLTLDSTINELLDNPAALTAVMVALEKIDPRLIDRLLAGGSTPMRSAMMIFPQRETLAQAIEQALAESQT